MKYNNIDGIELGQFNEIIIELGYYDDGAYYMSDFDEIVTIGGWEAVRLAIHGRRFGYPRDYFNPYDKFFAFDEYGNLMSIPENMLQEYFDQFRDEILGYVNTNEVELFGVEEEEE